MNLKTQYAVKTLRRLLHDVWSIKDFQVFIPEYLLGYENDYRFFYTNIKLY